MGVETGAAILGAGVISSAVGAMTSSASIKNSTNENYRNRKWQSEENQKTRDFNAEEAEKQRQWASDEWTKQFEAQRDEWYKQLEAQYGSQWTQFKKQFDYEAEYNSPQNQVQRLAQAGLNPAAAMSGGSAGLVSAVHAQGAPTASPSVPTGGAVTGAPASAGATGASTSSIPPMQNPLSEVGSLLRDLSEASKTNATLKPMVDNITADTQLKMASAGFQDIMKSWYEIEVDINKKTKSARVEKALNELKLQYVEMFSKASQGRYYEAMAYNTEKDTLIKELEHKLKGVELLDALTRIQYVDQMYQLQLQDYAAGVSMKKAATGKMIAETQTEDAMRDVRVELTSLQRDFQALANDAKVWDNKFLRESYDARLKSVIEDANQAGYITKQQATELHRMRYELLSAPAKDAMDVWQQFNSVLQGYIPFVTPTQVKVHK